METPIRKGMSPLLTWLDAFSQSSDNNKVYNTLFWIGLSKLIEIDSTVRPYPEKENPSLLSLFCWTVTQLLKTLYRGFFKMIPKWQLNINVDCHARSTYFKCLSYGQYMWKLFNCKEGELVFENSDCSQSELRKTVFSYLEDCYRQHCNRSAIFNPKSPFP